MVANSLSLIIKLLVETGSSKSTIDSLKKAFLGLTAATGTFSITSAFVEANREIEKLLRGLNAISSGRGDVYFERLANSAERIGIPIKEVAQSFLEVNAATKGTSFEGTKTQAIFEALANALSTTGADAVRFNRGFRALGQILSKDQLFAEELRQQLGEALPTAIQDFARALRISPAQLFKFMEQGVIKGEDLRRTLVLVTKEWQKTFKIVDKQNFTVDQKLALVQNQLLLLFKIIGDTGIWRAFGDSILYVEGLLVDARSGIRNLDAEIKAIYKTISQFASDVKNDLGGFGDDLGNALNNVEFSPTGLIRNFRFLFQALPNEARLALQPIEDAIAGIDFGKIVAGVATAFQGIGQGIGVFAASTKDLFETFARQAGIFDQIPVQFKNVVVAGIKDSFSDIYEFILLKINDIGYAFNKLALDFKLTFKDIFGTQTGVEAVLADIKKLDEAYKQSEITIKERKAIVASTYQEEVGKLKQLTTAITNEGSQWRERTNTAFSGIADAISKNFDQLNINRGIERQNVLLQQSSDREKQRSLFHKEYIDNLSAEARVKNPLLIISREQAKLEQDKLKLSQSYNDSVMDATASQYKRWAQQGQITQEAAAFFEKSAKDNAAYKAWMQAQDAVDKYNQEVKKSAGVSEAEVAARKETLDALREQANQQLAYASSKAKEIGDANRLKKIYEEQTALIESQGKIQQDFQKVLKNAEINTLIVAPSEDNAKAVINDTQKKISEIKPGVVVPTTIDPATQEVVREYEDPITKLPDATQYVKRVYSDSSGTSIPTPQRLGGPIPGYGGGDRLHYLLEPGEFVLRKEAARSIGIGQLEQMNRLGGKFRNSLIDNVSLPRMASGGEVTGAPIVINVPGQKSIRLSGSRDQAVALANLLTSVGRAA